MNSQPGDFVFLLEDANAIGVGNEGIGRVDIRLVEIGVMSEKQRFMTIGSGGLIEGSLCQDVHPGLAFLENGFDGIGFKFVRFPGLPLDLYDS
jgi:hypothetical protein